MPLNSWFSNLQLYLTIFNFTTQLYDFTSIDTNFQNTKITTKGMFYPRIHNNFEQRVEQCLYTSIVPRAPKLQFRNKDN